jgi:hypothetical protein
MERFILRDIYLFAHTASKHARAAAHGSANKQRHCVKFIANREALERVLIWKKNYLRAKHVRHFIMGRVYWSRDTHSM